MAMLITAPEREVPRFTLLTSYTVHRSGVYPVVTAMFEEMVYITDEEWDVVGVREDGALCIPALLDRSGLVGRLVSTLDSVRLGTILSITPDGEDVWVLLSDPHSITAPGRVALVGRMPVGTPAYRRASGGRQWDVTLHGSNPQAMAKIGQMLGATHVASTMAVLQILNAQGKTDITTVTPQDVLGAVYALSLQGLNIDGFLATAGEQLEASRRAGLAPYLSVSGEAPQPSTSV